MNYGLISKSTVYKYGVYCDYITIQPGNCKIGRVTTFWRMWTDYRKFALSRHIERVTDRQLNDHESYKQLSIGLVYMLQILFSKNKCRPKYNSVKAVVTWISTWMNVPYWLTIAIPQAPKGEETTLTMRGFIWGWPKKTKSFHQTHSLTSEENKVLFGSRLNLWWIK